MIGVSPAYYISLFGTHFTLDQLTASMAQLAEGQFESLQLEVYHPQQLDQWTEKACRDLRDQSREKGLRVSQFVAHFLLSTFRTVDALRSEEGYREMEFIAGRLIKYGLTRVVTIPLPAFEGEREDPQLRALFDARINRYWEILSLRNLSLALEPLPGSLGEDLSFLDRHGRVGLNLDPGHLLCSGIDPFSLDARYLSRVYATHLCENDGRENLSLPPGTFSGRWEQLLSRLREAGYRGALDLEILCAPGEAEEAYRKGRIFLQENVYKINNSHMNSESRDAVGV